MIIYEGKRLSMMLTTLPDNGTSKTLWQYKPLGLAVHTPSFAMLVLGWSF